MFATLVGPYPHISGSPRECLRATVADQLEAGLGILNDGQVHGTVGVGSAAAVVEWVVAVVEAWRAADLVGRELAAVSGIEPPLVKACLLGPWSSGDGDPRRIRAAADDVVSCVRALFRAGAPIVQVTEPALGAIDPGDSTALDLLEEVLATLTQDVEGHLSLALAGGRPTAIPPARLFSAPFGSYLFDLIRSPDDWSLCARVPATSGLIVGVADARTPVPDTEAVSIWGARYAASLGGRGPGRVGVTTSAGLESLARDAARTKLAALAEAGRKADLPDAELAPVIDPRAVNARSAALGRYEPPRRRC